MHSIYVEIVCQTVRENYGSETYYWKKVLTISRDQWESWKEGQSTISPEVNQKIMNLFSDYEWMLVQKVLRQAMIYPEKRLLAMENFRKMKLRIAKEWIDHDLGIVEVAHPKQASESKPWIHLKVTVMYNEWGFDDVLTFRVPAVLQTAIAGETQALLEWMNESIDDTENEG